MKRLLCRWIEYYLALCEDDIEHRLPGWVERHLQACARCQAELRAYRHTREAVRQYASLLPDAPAEGWQPLQVRKQAKQRAFPLHIALAPVAIAVVAVIGFVLWHRGTIPVHETNQLPQMAQATTPKRQEPVASERKPAAEIAIPSARDSQPEPVATKQPASPPRSKPAPSLRHTPPAYRPPERIVIAVQPKQQTAPAADAESPVAPPHEAIVPVQPVAVEAHPVTSAPVPEGYVIETAYPATAGAVE